MNKRKALILLLCSLVIALFGCTKDNDDTSSSKTKAENTSSWTESPLFTSESYTMIGVEGKAGFIYDGGDVTKHYVNEEQKYMWHFWGDSNDFEGTFKVLATHESDKNEPVTLLENVPLGGRNNGADQHAPSNFSLPESGKWKLDIYFGEDLFESIFITVHERT